MICVAYTDRISNKVVRIPYELINESSDFSGKWVHLAHPDSREIAFISSRTGISTEYLTYALDEEERSRVDKEDDTLMLLVDFPISDDSVAGVKNAYTTLPLGIIMRQDFFVTVCLTDCDVTKMFFSGKVKNVDINVPSRTTFQVLLQIATSYLSKLRDLDKASQKIKRELHKSMKNKELLELLEIENSLVYFSTSLRSNASVIDKLIKNVNLMPRRDEDQDLIEDCLTENLQAIEMCTIYRDILAGTMDSCGSIINNNLNIVMKLLTAITLVLSIPTLIASLFGMNLEGIPWATGSGHYPWAFGLVSGISIILAVITGIVMYKKKML